MTGRPLLCLALATAALAACAGPPDEATRQKQATIAACREHANAVYASQNRGAIYGVGSQRDSPYSASGLAGVTSYGLSTTKDYDDAVASCVRGSTANTDADTAPAPTPTPAPAKH